MNGFTLCDNLVCTTWICTHPAHTHVTGYLSLLNDAFMHPQAQAGLVRYEARKGPLIAGLVVRLVQTRLVSSPPGSSSSLLGVEIDTGFAEH